MQPHQIYMKKYLILILILLESLFVFSQISTYNIKDEQAGQLRRRVLLFVYRNSDATRLDELKEAVKYGWMYSDVKFISINELSEYEEDQTDYSFLTINVVKNNGNVSTTLDLWYRFNESKELLASINLYVNRNTETQLQNMSNPGESLYSGGVIYDWNPGFMKMYIKILNDWINKRKERGKKRIFYDKAYLNTFWSKTLIVSDLSLIARNGTINKERAEHLYKKYPYNYKVKTNNEISEMLFNPERPFYFAHLCKNGKHWYYCFYSSTGQLVYSHRLNRGELNLYIIDKFIKILME